MQKKSKESPVIKPAELPSTRIAGDMIKIRLAQQEKDIRTGDRTVLSDNAVFQEAVLNYLDEWVLTEFYRRNG